MNMKNLASTVFVLAALAAAAPSSYAQAGAKVGVITCDVVPGSRLNLLIRSTADVECVYEFNGATERYVGETGIALGLDLSFRSNEKMAFSVVAASSDIAPGSGALSGRYVGAEVGAAAALGLGAKALVGAGETSIGLSPLALETNEGLGVSGGLSFLYLEAAR